MYHLKQIPSKRNIQKFLKKVLFGKHIFCPICKSFNIISYENRYRCRKCKTKFSLLSHTWLNNVKIPLPQFWLVLWCWTQRMPVRQTERLVSLSEKTVRHWFDLFRSNLPKDKTILKHIVQLDDAYEGIIPSCNDYSFGHRTFFLKIVRTHSSDMESIVRA